MIKKICLIQMMKMKKKKITELDDDEDHYLELQDNLEEYSRHYEENSVVMTEGSNND